MIPVLMVALEFAPVQTTGAFRSIAFAEHLSKLGFTPIVVTMEAAAGAAIMSAPINAALLSRLPDSVITVPLSPDRLPKRRGRLGEFWRIATNLDDRFFLRFHHALRDALPMIAARHAPKAVYVSAPPFGAARLGELAAKTLGVPWVLDMRDAWAEWGMAPLPHIGHYRARRRDESRAFADADAVITVTKHLRDVFRDSHPALPAEKFHVIPNGFDGDALQGGLLPESQSGDIWQVAYVGSYYYTPPKPRSLRRPHALLQYSRGDEDWSYRSPLYFFRAWRELKKIDPVTGARVRFNHIGGTPDWLAGMAADHGVLDQCVFHGLLPKQDLAGVLDTMEAQLATSMKRPRGGDYCLASKTFDYILARKPIVAFVTEGSQRDFLNASGVSIEFDPDDAPGSAARLRDMIVDRPRLSLDASYVNRFQRREGAKRLAVILRQTIAGKPIGLPEAPV